MNGPYPVPQQPMRGPQLPVERLQRFLRESLPGAAVAHSYHVDALRQPQVRNDPSFQRFTQIEVNELHHQIAAMGSLMRVQMGDPNAVNSLGYNLGRFVANRQAAAQVAQQFPPAVRQNPDVQRMMALIQQSNRQVEQNWPLLSQAMAASGMGSPPPPRLGNGE